MKIITVIGARPQFIKAAPFSAVYRKNHHEVLVHTGQHYDENMSAVFFDELGLPKPDYNLGVGSGGHGQQTGRMLEKIEEIILLEKPDGLLVYGDTNSTLAGALAASKLHVPVFHVEAGLRSYNKRMPEEQNRVLTDHLASLLLCPTQTAVSNLKNEGITEGVLNTGDIMYDTVLRNIGYARSKYQQGAWLDALRSDNDVDLELEEKDYILATIHRAENTDDPHKLLTIFRALDQLGLPVLFPIHPRTRKMIHTMQLTSNNIHLVQPVGYLLMLYLTAHARMVVTDSGGLQKEAFFLQTPCTTLRDQTEWIETLANQWNMLCPIDEQSIITGASRTLPNHQNSQRKAFGDGTAALRILDAIIDGGVHNA